MFFDQTAFVNEGLEIRYNSKDISGSREMIGVRSFFDIFFLSQFCREFWFETLKLINPAVDCI